MSSPCFPTLIMSPGFIISPMGSLVIAWYQNRKFFGIVSNYWKIALEKNENTLKSSSPHLPNALARNVNAGVHNTLY